MRLWRYCLAGFLNNSLAFGGYDAVVTFARPGVLPPPVLSA